MKFLKISIVLIVMLIFGCNQKMKSSKTEKSQKENNISDSIIIIDNPLIGNWKLKGVSNNKLIKEKEFIIYTNLEFSKTGDFYFKSISNTKQGKYEYLDLQILMKDIKTNNEKYSFQEILNFSHLDSLNLIMEIRTEIGVEFLEYEKIKI